jgi:hypothetical protein
LSSFGLDHDLTKGFLMCLLSAVELPIISKCGLGSDDFLCCFSFADDELLLSEPPTSSLLDNHTFMKGIFTLFLLPTLGGYGIKKMILAIPLPKSPLLRQLQIVLIAICYIWPNYVLGEGTAEWQKTFIKS